MLFLNFSFFAFSDLNCFCTFAGIKKQKISAYFANSVSKLFIAAQTFLDFLLILSITAQSIFAVEPSTRARWKGILIKNITKIKNKKNNNKL
jgi:hypothetical protein